MKVVYRVRRGDKIVRETEQYKDLDEAARGIQERVTDPFSPQIDTIVEVSDRKGRLFDVEWAPVLVPKAA